MPQETYTFFKRLTSTVAVSEPKLNKQIFQSVTRCN